MDENSWAEVEVALRLHRLTTNGLLFSVLVN